MSIIEAFRERIQKPEPQWTAGESLERLELLQGQTVNLLPVLQHHNILDHAHYRPQWHPDQQEEPTSLRSVVSAILDQRVAPFEGPGPFWDPESLKLADVYTDYFTKQGIEGTVRVFRSSEEKENLKKFELIVEPESWRVNLGDVWSPRKTIALFPWIDFFGNFSMTEEAKSEAMKRGVEATPVIYFSINTTRVEGNLYSIDIPTYMDGKMTLDSLLREGRAAYVAFWGLSDGELGTDTVALGRRDQKLVTNLLMARV